MILTLAPLMAFGLASVTAIPLSGNSTLHTRASVSSLFPVSHPAASWTVSAGIAGALPLNDATLLPHGDTGAHSYVVGPDRVPSMQAHYPKGATKPSRSGGVSFFASGPASVDLTKAKEATLAYSVFFPNGFDFALGGTLPGFYGGTTDAIGTSCTPGRGRHDNCFVASFDWRGSGAGELFALLPDSAANTAALCNVRPVSQCSDQSGAFVGRGAFSFTPGARATVAQRVLLNDVGKANGEIEIFLEGRSVFAVKGLEIVKSAASRFRGIRMQSFFNQAGGSPKDQDAFLGDFSVAITKAL